MLWREKAEVGEGSMLKSVKEIFTDCTLCYHSCGTVVTVEDGKAIEVEGLKTHPLNQGMLCPKGRAALENVYDPHRLKYPLKKVNGNFERITWDQALTEIAEKLFLSRHTVNTHRKRIYKKLRDLKSE